MEQMDYLIVGAGLTGATLARELTDAGKQCLVIDKRNHIGGNVFTQRMDGIDVHTYGAHIFHTSNDALWQYVHRFVRMNRFTNSPIANYRGRLYNLPFNMNTFYQLWGVQTPQEAMARIAAQREAARIGTPKNLEEQAISLVGTDIYEKLVKGYTEKQWGRPAGNCPRRLFAASLCASPLTIITSMRRTRAFQRKAIRRSLRGCWKVLKYAWGLIISRNGLNCALWLPV